jgi:hypothetical protein
VKLYADNGYSFHTYISGEQFGDGEVFAGIRRIGTARAYENQNLMYSISSFEIE